MKRFSGGFSISVSLPATDLECLIKILVFTSLNFKQIAFKQCLPLLAIPMIWNHLVFFYFHCVRLHIISVVAVCIRRHQKHDYADNDQFSPYFDMAYKTIQRVSVLNLKLVRVMKTELSV